MNRQIGFVQLVRRTIETSPQRCYPDLEKVRKKVKKNLCCFLLPGWLYNGIFYYISLKLNHLMQLFGESASAKIETFAQGGSDGSGRHSATPMLTAIMSGGVGISDRELSLSR